MPIERGEIYFVNLNPVEGPEQAGQRTRTARNMKAPRARNVIAWANGPGYVHRMVER